MPPREFVARPTIYRGIQMRSRLEASFAQWLDACSVEWAYEPVAFAGRGGQYLPDFEVFGQSDGQRWFYEVKPTQQHALSVAVRMEIIWESDPAAWLSIAISEPPSFYHRDPARPGDWYWASAEDWRRTL